MLVMSTSIRDGIQVATIVEGDWQIERRGWVSPWTATHTPTGTVIHTEVGDPAEAWRVTREQRPDLFPEPAASGARYTVESRFDRRFSGHRQGDPQ